MKTGTTDLIKFRLLQRDISRSKATTVGHLDLMWNYANTHCVSEFSPDEIEMICEWDGEPGALFSALLSHRWIDAVEEKNNRYELHDYFEHCPEYIHKRLVRKELRLAKKRRQTADIVGQTADNVEITATNGDKRRTTAAVFPSVTGKRPDKQNKTKQNKTKQNIYKTGVSSVCVEGGAGGSTHTHDADASHTHTPTPTHANVVTLPPPPGTRPDAVTLPMRGGGRATLDADVLTRLQLAYPALDVLDEAARAAHYLASHTQSQRASPTAAVEWFDNNWLSRARDASRGEAHGYAHTGPVTTYEFEPGNPFAP